MLSAKKSVDEKPIGVNDLSVDLNNATDGSADKIVAYHFIPLVLKYFGLPGDDGIYRNVRDYKKKRFHFFTNYWMRANATYLKTMSFCVGSFLFSFYLLSSFLNNLSGFFNYLFSFVGAVFVYVSLVHLIRFWFGDFFSKKDVIANSVGVYNYPSYLFLKELGIDTIKSFASQRDKIMYFLLWCDDLMLKQSLPESGSMKNMDSKFKVRLGKVKDTYNMLLEGGDEDIFNDADKVEQKLMSHLLDLTVDLAEVIKWEIKPGGFYEDLGVLFIKEYKVKNNIVTRNVSVKTTAQLKEESNLYLMELIGKKK